jgi:hypothetical protein
MNTNCGRDGVTTDFALEKINNNNKVGGNKPL